MSDSPEVIEMAEVIARVIACGVDVYALAPQLFSAARSVSVEPEPRHWLVCITSTSALPVPAREHWRERLAMPEGSTLLFAQGAHDSLMVVVPAAALADAAAALLGARIADWSPG